MVEVRIAQQCNLLDFVGYTKKEEAAIYNANLQEVIDNPKKWLQQLESLPTYRVSWKNYGFNTPTFPKPL